jgi:WD40-like Beta Propeller Repeat
VQAVRAIRVKRGKFLKSGASVHNRRPEPFGGFCPLSPFFRQNQHSRRAPRAILLIVKHWVLAVIASAPLLGGQGEFRPANFTTVGGVGLKLFPADGPATVVKIPFNLWLVKFASDGRSLYASLQLDPLTKPEQTPGLVRLDLNSMRSTPVAGTQGFGIKDFAVTHDGRKIVISGNHREKDGGKCGLFEIMVSTGAARRVLAADCGYRWSWTDLTISPAGDRAAAGYGNTHTDHNYRLDLIDLAHGTTKSIGDLDRATWSPDGKWIAAIEWNRKRLVLLDANDLSRRRDLGSTVSAAWSPDSRYLLTWKWHFLKCGFFIDVEPPASFEVLEVATGKRSLIRSSQCQLIAGPIGWVSSDVGK